jgi:putative copper export protein
LAPEAATKAILYAALLPTVGASAAFLFVAARLEPRSTETLEHSIRRVGLVAATFVVVALVLRVWAQADAAFGLAGSLSPGFHQVLTSRWGERWHWQLLAAIACAIAYACAGGGRRAAWLAAAVASVALCVSLTLTGHAAGDPVRMAIHAAHLVGGSLWLGTLATLVAVWRSIDANERATLFHAFSPLALAGAGIAAAAGATAAIMYVGAFENLWLAAYGRTLVVKLAFVVGAVSCGYLNWRRVSSGQAPARATVELLFAAAIVIVTAVLTELEHP